ncbi:MAG: glycosyltransferase, partial [Phycisphaerales bacterium]|nr:glycosyltransferase [Phycisphaerales bacterium]
MATIIDQNDTAIGLDYNDQARSAALPIAPNLERGLVTPRHARALTPTAGITVIVPCFNEESMVTATVRRIAQTLSDAERPFEVIIVDDGS